MNQDDKVAAQLTETYSVKAICTNCGYDWMTSFQRGTSRASVVICPICGCHTGKTTPNCKGI
jgi:hypothetical protein